MLNEEHIKAYLCEHLIEKGHVGTGVLLHEKVYGSSATRRADLVIANGKLHAFEIKSDCDSLKRLPGQVASYIKFFDKVTIACTAKFISTVLEILPIHVGIIEVVNQNKGLRFKRIRAGRSFEIKNKYNLCNFLTVSDLIILLRENDVTLPKRRLRKNLIPLATSLPICTLRKFLLRAIKSKYVDKYQKYLALRGTTSTISAFKALTDETENSISCQTERPPNNAQHIDYSAMFPEEDIPPTMPQYVLKRQVTTYYQSRSSSSCSSAK